MLGDRRALVVGVQGASGFAGVYPGCRAGSEIHGATRPGLAICASNIRSHLTVGHTGSLEKRDLRVTVELGRVVAGAETRRNGDVVAICRSVHDEDVGARHGASLAETDP